MSTTAKDRLEVSALESLLARRCPEYMHRPYLVPLGRCAFAFFYQISPVRLPIPPEHRVFNLLLYWTKRSPHSSAHLFYPIGFLSYLPPLSLSGL